MALQGLKRTDISDKRRRRNISYLPLLSLLFLLPNSLWAVDPSKRISQYAHTSWQRRDGIFNGTPDSITQTTDGYIWIGTEDGLVRFDGVRFVKWNPPEGNQLPSTAITSLLSTRDGSLWIGTKTGLSRWQNNTLINFLPNGGVIDSIIEDRKGSIWVVQQRIYDQIGPLCRVVQDAEMKCYGKAGETPLSRCCLMALMEDPQEGYWIGDDTRIIHWKASFSSTYNPTGLKPNAGQFGVNSFAAMADGSLWAGMYSRGPDMGLQHLERGVWKRFVTSEFDSSKLGVSRLLVDRENSLWIGTTGQGLYRIRGPRVDHFDSSNGLSNDFVTGLYEDREGNLWVSTMKGIDNFRDIQVASFSKGEGLALVAVGSVLASRDGAIWAGGEALDILRQSGVSYIQSGQGLPGNQVTSMLEDHTGRIWVGIDNMLTIYKNGKFSRISKLDGSPIGLVTGMTEDVENNIWVEIKGPPRTLFRIKDLKVREEFPEPLMPAARRLAADPQKGIWLGLMSGDLARYRDGKLDIFPFPHGSDPFVSELIVNLDGSVLGATESGVIGWKIGKQQTLTDRNGLPCNNIFTLASDRDANLWLYTECGLIKIAKTELLRWWESPQVSIQLRHFDVNDGALPAWVPFGGVTRAPDGRLWFANQSTLQMIDPSRLLNNNLRPPVHVEEIIANSKRYLPQEGLRLPAHIRDLEIDYTALSFVTPQKVLFRYKLENHDRDWEQPGTRRQAFYSDLSPGKYRFRVIACNNDGIWNDVGASLDFSVAPAWYQTYWFRIVCALACVFALWSLYQLRVRQIAAAMSTRFDERLAERTRLARELHDTLLQTIQGSKMVADDALHGTIDPIRMRRAMERVSNWLGRATSEGRAALNSLRSSPTQQNDLAEALKRSTEEFLVQSSLQTVFSLTGEVRAIHPIIGDDVYHIAHEAIRNAHLHSGGSRLEIDLTYARDLKIRIKDNGTAIDEVVAEKGKAGHFGLQGMRERAARIGATLSLVSSAATGTEIIVSVPGAIIFQQPNDTLFTKFKSLCKRRSDRPKQL